MNFTAKIIITEVKEGEKRDYANIVDLETGGIASVSAQRGWFADLPLLQPIDVIGIGKLGRYGMELIRLHVKGGE